MLALNDKLTARDSLKPEPVLRYVISCKRKFHKQRYFMLDQPVNPSANWRRIGLGKFR